MSNRDPKYKCPQDGALVRRPGKHANQKHADLRPTKFRRLVRLMIATKGAKS